MRLPGASGGSSLRAVLALLASSSLAEAQTKLNAPLPRAVAGSVRSHAWSPDGAFLVYVADERQDEVFELFAVPADGSAAPVVLSGVLVDGGDVATPAGTAGSLAGAFEITPDSAWVLFVADAAVDGFHELWRVPIDGSLPPAWVAHALVPGGDVVAFSVAPDGGSVVLLADGLRDERFELFRVSSDGSLPPVQLSAPLVVGGDVSAFVVGATSTRAYYLADGLLDGVPELFSVALDAASPAVRLNDALAAGRGVADFAVASDESRVVFRADAVTNDVFELFGAPADGSGAPVRLSAPGGGTAPGPVIAPGDDRVVYGASGVGLLSAPLDGSAAAIPLSLPGEIVSGFRFEPGGAALLYWARPSNPDPFHRLLRVPTDGSAAPLLLHDPLASNVFIRLVEVSADGSFVVFSQEVQVFNGYNHDSHENLLRMPVGGGPAVPLTSNVAGHGLQHVQAFAIVEGGTRVVYANDEPSGSTRLRTVLADGSAPSEAFGSAASFTVDAGGTRLAFIERLGPDRGRLWTAQVDGASPFPLSGPAVPGAILGDVVAHAPTPDGRQVVYVVAQTGQPDQILVVGVDGATPARDLSPLEPALVRAGPIHGPRSDRAAFVLEDFFSEEQYLFTVPLRAPGPGARVEALGLHGDVSSFEPVLFTPDGLALLYLATAPGIPSATQLFRVPSDAGAPPERLNGTGADRSIVTPVSNSAGDPSYALTPDGTRVVYVGAVDRLSSATNNLFTRRLDLADAPLQLSAMTQPSSGVYRNWRITPDGGRVVYFAPQEVLQRGELFSVPVDGSAAPLKLNPPLVAGGEVGSRAQTAGFSRYARCTPDGTRVVYLADQEVDERRELYGVPVDGSAAAVRLSGTLVAGGDVSPFFELDGGGNRVLFLADATVDETQELYSAPIDGSGPVVALSRPLLGPVPTFFATSGLFLAKGRVGFAIHWPGSGDHLYGRVIDGSAPRLRLDTNLAGTENVLMDRTWSATGGDLLYRVRRGSGAVELHRVPRDGSLAPVRIGPALPFDRGVQPDVVLSADGMRVFWRVDQEADERFELYTQVLELRTRRSTAPPP